MSKPSRSPLVSIVIPAYNEEKYIKATVHSVLDQKTDADVEVLVINNVSTDKTAETAKQCGATVIFEKRKGLNYARRAGLNHAKGSLLIYIDADTHLPNDFVAKALVYFADHKDVVGTSYAFDFYDRIGIFSRFTSFLYRQIITRLVNLVLKLSHKPEMFWGLCMVIRAQDFREVGGNDMNFPFYGEDTAIAYRLFRKGKVKFLYNPKVMTSARRYTNHDVYHYLSMTIILFLMLHLGHYDKAKEFTQKHTI